MDEEGGLLGKLHGREAGGKATRKGDKDEGYRRRKGRRIQRLHWREEGREAYTRRRTREKGAGGATQERGRRRGRGRTTM